MITYVTHLLMPSHTIMAILRKYNKYPDETKCQELYRLFIEKNGSRVFKAGEKVQVPVMED